ncbi:unnamed protein product [Ilex paraguariensis]|uniref:LIM zinc-binding domain-containing protein n=1 Tax=Ilex paraguariensis TaxID=185542 RepID=A0ABC8UGB0_9AQUA
MSFTGTLDKCKACDKTVYFVDLLSADGTTYHKSCFKCSHCKGTLVTRAPSKLSALFSGTLDKCSACNKTVYPLEKDNRITHILHTQTNNNPTMDPISIQVTMEEESYHKTCFKCAHGGCPLTHSSYAALDGILYCKHHFAQLFMEKGNYQHVLKATTHRKSGVALVEPESAEAETEPKPEPESEHEHTQEQS